MMACLLAGGFFALIAELLLNGWAHSFDSAIYIRNLWGLSHGDSFNPIVGFEALSVHFNLVMVPLAWISRVIPAWIVMSLTVSLSFTATYFLSAWHAARAVAKTGADRSSLIGVVILWSMLLACAPMVANPFIFDVRPDVIGVPLIAGALFRARRTKTWDWTSIVCMVLAIAVREEFAFVVAAAAALSPWNHRSRQQQLRRLGLALFAIGWIAGYWYVIRPWMNDGSFDRAHQVASAFVDDGSELSLLRILGYKFEIVVTFCFGVGGLALFGWRWLGAALPGLVLALATSRMQPLVLNFHYIMFCTPGLVVASVDGLERVAPWISRQSIRRSSAVLLALVTASIAIYSTSSAIPFGGRFRQQNFAVAADEDSPLTESQQNRLLSILAGVRHRLAPTDGIVLPYGLSGSFAWRRTILMWEAVAESLRDGEPWPDGVDMVVLPRSDWGAFAEPLTHSHGYTLVELIEPDAAILQRSPEAHLAELQLVDIYGSTPCDHPIATWHEVNTELCSIEPLPDGRVALWVRHDGGTQARGTPWSLHVGNGNGLPGRTQIHSGLVAPWQLGTTPIPSLSRQPVDPAMSQYVVEARSAAGVLMATLDEGTLVQQIIIRVGQRQ
jgi:uncharacterized membrane protein